MEFQSAFLQHLQQKRTSLELVFFFCFLLCEASFTYLLKHLELVC